MGSTDESFSNTLWCWGCPALCGKKSWFGLESHNSNYLRGWRKIRQELALGVGVGRWGWGWLFGLGSALWVGVGPAFSWVGVGPSFSRVGLAFFLEVRVGVD